MTIELTKSEIDLLTYALEVTYECNADQIKSLTDPDERYERNDCINQNQAILSLKEKLCAQ